MTIKAERHELHCLSDVIVLLVPLGSQRIQERGRGLQPLRRGTTQLFGINHLNRPHCRIDDQK